MDFFVTRHNAQTGQDHNEDFAKAIQQRYGPGQSSILSNFDPSVLPSPKRKLAQSLAGSSAVGNTEEIAGESSRSAQSSKQIQFPPGHFQSVSPAELETMDAFIVDIRPHAAYASARIPNAISLSVPSTLLKRPLFSLDRLSAMLPSSAARQRFGRWREAKKIVVYDADTSGSMSGGTLPEGSNILGLLRKFANEDSGVRFDGQLYWLKGGFQRVWRERKHLVDTRPPLLDEEDEENNSATVVKNSIGASQDSAVGPGSFAGVGDGKSFATGTLRPTGLPTTAFNTSSTHRALPTPSLHGRRETSRPSLTMSMGHNAASMAANPFFDVIRQNTELSQGITEGIPLRLPKRVRRRIEDLPFQWLKDIGRRAGVASDSSSASDDSRSDYESDSSVSSESGRAEAPRDSTRQSDPSYDDSRIFVEVDGVKEEFLTSKASTAAIVSCTETSPASDNVPSDLNNVHEIHTLGSLSPQSSGSDKNKLTDPHSTSSSSPGGSSDSLADPDPALVDQGMENLAMQFYRIELAEQRRLMGIMQHHSREGEVENRKALTGENESDTWIQPHMRGESRDTGDIQMDVDDQAIREEGPETTTRRRTMSSPSTPFPYSITAGVEKGAKNRYRHIWPFEHARVRLHKRQPDETASGVNNDSSSHPALSSSAFQPASLTNPLSGTTPTSGFPDGPQPFLTTPQAHNPPRYPGLNLGGFTPSGPLAGPIYGPGRSPSPPKPSSAGPPGGGAAAFTLTLPMKRGRPSSPGVMSSPPFPSNSKPSMSLTLPGSGSSLPSSFTQYRNANTGSGGSGGESTATESEWESGTDKAYGSARKKEISAERKRKEEAARQYVKEPYDDYVNASYVQPLCTTRRYIATQGPLEATFVDFWTLVYQQNVHVIVMLTREVEGSMVKSGAYWKDERYGPLELKLVNVEGRIQEEQEPFVSADNRPETGGFFFPVMPDPNAEPQKGKSKKAKKVTIKDRKDQPKKDKRRSSSATTRHDSHLPPSDLPIIKRTFLLRHTAYPNVPPRRIVHFQFLDWPDMNVPDDPRGILGLIKEVDKAVEEADIVEPKPDSPDSEREVVSNNCSFPTKALGVRFFDSDSPRKHSRKPSEQEIDKYTGIAKHALGRDNAPVLMHCSAGVGRTGGFIAIDAVLDGVRREIQKVRRAEREAATKLENARRAMQLRAEGGSNTDIMMNEVSPNGGGSGDGSGDVDMADATIETVPIPAGHGGDVLHVVVHREMVPNEGPNPHSERGRKSSGAMAPANEVQMTMPTQVDPISSTTKDKEMLRIKQREEADTTTRMWSQNVSDQTGHYGSASRVSLSKDFAENGVGTGAITLLSSSVPPSIAPATMDSDMSSPSTSDDSFGFTSAFDKRFSDKIASAGIKSSHLTQKSGSATSLSAGSGNGKKYHTRTSSSSLAGPHLRATSLRERTSSAPSGRPAEVSTAVGEGGNHDSFVISPPSSQARSNASPAPWLLAEVEKRAESSPTPFSAVDAPPLSRSLSPFQPPAEASSSSRTSSFHTSGSNGGSNSGTTDLRRIIANRSSESPPANAGSGVESYSDSRAASVPTTTTTTSGSGTGSGSRSSSGNGSGTGFASGSGTGSRSTSVSIAESPPQEGGVLPTAGTDSAGSKSLRGINKKLDKVASAAAEAATSKLKSTEIQRAAFDYTEPRPLHQHDSPLALSIFKIPLLEVVQDMREQRMSLCQSLRQYVFVHAVVIEGALMILDDENEKDGIPRKRPRRKSKSRRKRKSVPKKGVVDEVMSDITSKTDVSSVTSSTYSKADNGGSISTGTSSNKRQASPTELPQEDKKGGLLLHKKPSLKRKQGTSSDE